MLKIKLHYLGKQMSRPPEVSAELPWAVFMRQLNKELKVGNCIVYIDGHLDQLAHTCYHNLQYSDRSSPGRAGTCCHMPCQRRPSWQSQASCGSQIQPWENIIKSLNSQESGQRINSSSIFALREAVYSIKLLDVQTSAFWLRARAWAWPRSPKPVMSVAACALYLCINLDIIE